MVINVFAVALGSAIGGGLTTFSTFSLEVMEHLTSGHIALAGTVALMHLIGSVSATIFGFWLAKSCFS